MSTHRSTHKGKRHQLMQEMTRMANVLVHPMFAANPTATLQQHLKNTMSA